MSKSLPAAPPAPAMLLANLPSPVLALDGERRLAFANPAAEQLFGAGWPLLEGRRLDGFVTPHSPLLALVEEARRSGNSISDYGVELAFLRGEAIDVDCHLTPLAERPDHVLAVLHPCSVARRLDQHLAHRGSTRSVAALAAILAHEVKNPLSGIRGAAQLLEPYIGAEDKALVRLIVDETDRIVTLIDRMEEFSDASSIQRRPVNIHQVLEHVRRLAENGFARNHRIVELYDPSLPEVEGDRDRLVQVFLNLVKNAAEASPGRGGQITIVTHYRHGLRMSIGTSSARQDLPITVEIRDSGPGVREDLQDHLFEAFVSTKPKGGGLGLALVAKIVGDHGGMVSYAPGDPGAIFRVRLAAAERRRAAAPAEARP